MLGGVGRRAFAAPRRRPGEFPDFALTPPNNDPKFGWVRTAISYRAPTPLMTEFALKPLDPLTLDTGPPGDAKRKGLIYLMI